MVKSERIDPSLSQVMRIVGVLYRRALRALDDAHGDVSVGTRTVLELLAQTAPQPVPAMARTLELSRQFVQRSVDEGVGAELLELSENPAHRRSKIVSLTPAGRTLIDSITAREEQLLAPAAKALSEEEIGTCLRVLRTVYEHTPGAAEQGTQP